MEEIKKKKFNKKWLWLIPFALIIALFIAYFFLGRGGLLLLFKSVDTTDMMVKEEFISENEVKLPYLIALPDNYDETRSYPLVLFLHGGGERGDDNQKQAKKTSIMQTLLNEQNKKDYPCIVIAPQCPDEISWNRWDLEENEIPWESEDDMLDALMELCIITSETYSVDKNRIYISGLSIGGFGTWNLITRYPDYFAAAVPVCGGGYTDGTDRIKDIPIWAFHGNWDTDVSVNFSREMVDAVKKSGSTKIKYTEYKMENHSSWELAWREDDLFPWMFAQEKQGDISYEDIDLPYAS